MQIAGRPASEFEYDSNVVACPRLHPGRASERARARARARARQDYVAGLGGKNIQICRAERLELESTFRRTRVCVSRRAPRDPEQGGKRATRVNGGKNIQISTRVCTTSLSCNIWTNVIRAVNGRMRSGKV